MLFTGGFYIDVRADVTFDGAMLCFKIPDVLPDQHQNMTVDAAALIVCHKADLFQHFLFNSDGHTLYRHKHHFIDI